MSEVGIVSVPEDQLDEVEIALSVKWNGLLYRVELEAAATIHDLKARLFELTDVQVSRQKILGLRAKGLPTDDTPLAGLIGAKRIMMVGTREAEIVDEIDEMELPDIINDFEDEKNSLVTARHIWMRRLERRLMDVTIRLISPLRAGKALLVLDLDYTLLDCKSPAERIQDMMRPGMHELLTSSYENYDLCIWSQTSWRWLEAKITELGVLSNPAYRLAFVLDRTAMFSIRSYLRTKRGRELKNHEVKALELIWRKFPENYGPHNTIHVDDLSRNFMLNPDNGLKISAFRNASRNRAVDRDLYLLQTYLKLIASREPDFRKVNHSRWKAYVEKFAGESFEVEE